MFSLTITPGCILCIHGYSQHKRQKLKKNQYLLLLSSLERASEGRKLYFNAFRLVGYFLGIVMFDFFSISSYTTQVEGLDPIRPCKLRLLQETEPKDRWYKILAYL